MKNLSKLSEVSHWYWEIHSIQHTADIFETRLDSLATSSLPSFQKNNVQQILKQVHQHKKDLSEIQLALQEYNSLSVSLKNNEPDQEQKVNQLEGFLRLKVNQEVDSFVQVKDQYFKLIREMLFA